MKIIFLLIILTLYNVRTQVHALHVQAVPKHEREIAAEICADREAKGSFANEIVRENCKEGSKSVEWDVNGAGHPSIQGFANAISYDVGDLVKFKVRAPTSDKWEVRIYRFGYYQGDRMRRVGTVHPHVALPQEQPDCEYTEETGLYDCDNWKVSAKWRVPKTAVSGFYMARFTRTDANVTSSGTWRMDASHHALDVKFAIPGADPKAPPAKRSHAYGALGIGRLRNAIEEPYASLAFFVIRPPLEERSETNDYEILFLVPTNTYHAYNCYGGVDDESSAFLPGRSLYGSFDDGNPRPRAYISSLNRPLSTRLTRAVNAPFSTELPAIAWLERNGYNVRYFADSDMDQFGAQFLAQNPPKSIVVPGHSEYWSGAQRGLVEVARDGGVHVNFWSGNDVFWRVRFERNYRHMVCYKETSSMVKLDPKRTEWTGTFRDSRPINPFGAQPENALIGTLFTGNAWLNDPMRIGREQASARLWRNTGVDEIGDGQEAYTRVPLLGHELNEALDNGFRPRALVELTRTPLNNVQYIVDHGATYDTGSMTHTMTVYRAPSGALVFSAATVHYAWALDGLHDEDNGLPAHVRNHYDIRIGRDPRAPERAIEQFTVNLFAEQGVHGHSLHPHLVDANVSADTVPPTCCVQSVASSNGVYRIRILASDDSGVVSGVDVSVNAGKRFHPARLESYEDEKSSIWTLEWREDNVLNTVGERFSTTGLACVAVDDSINVSGVFAVL